MHVRAEGDRLRRPADHFAVFANFFACGNRIKREFVPKGDVVNDRERHGLSAFGHAHDDGASGRRFVQERCRVVARGNANGVNFDFVFHQGDASVLYSMRSQFSAVNAAQREKRKTPNENAEATIPGVLTEETED